MNRLTRFIPVCIALGIGLLLLILRSTDHAPAHVVAADRTDVFSAQRAFAHLEDLLAENVPHPAGSDANRVIERRIVEKLRGFGYEPEIQAGTQCSTLASGCSAVRNIIAVRNGSADGQAVMITAHYDSVPGSPGAGDDGAGVATMLEIAQLLTQREPLRNDIVFLFTDAEETGLRGAMLFAEQHPLMQRIAAVVNMEARGVTGPSMMFETGAGNEAIVELLAQAAPRPVSTSMLFEVYRRMPNNTDFTIYKMRGVQGLNFAFSRGVALYHSERDDLAHLDKRSLQHHGDNTLSVLLRAGEIPPAELLSQNDASYFDAASRSLLSWPASWNVPLAIVALLLVILAAVRRQAVNWRAGLWAVAGILCLIVVIPVFGWLLSWPLGIWPRIHPLDHPFPWPGRIALIAASVLATFVTSVWIGRRAGTIALLNAVWVVMGLLALAVSLMVPGAAYVALVPTLIYGVAACTGLAARRRRESVLLFAAFAGFLAAGYMALYHSALADTVLNFHVSQFKILPLLLLALPVLPLACAYALAHSSRMAIGAFATVTVIAAVVGALVPAYTVDRPFGVNLLHVENGAGEAQWQLESFGEPSTAVLDAMQFGHSKRSIHRYGVEPFEAFVKSAPILGLPAPLVQIDEDIERDGERIVRGSVRSRRDTHRVAIGFPPQSPLRSMQVEGQTVIEKASAKARVVGLHGFRDAPLHFEIVAKPGEKLSFVASDIGPLPSHPQADVMLNQRPQTAAPLQSGNQSIVLNRVDL